MTDHVAMKELELWAYNTGSLNNQRMSIIANLKRKIGRGVYSAELAPKLWQYWVDAAARDYCKEFKCNMQTVFPKSLRVKLAENIAADEHEAIVSGEYDYQAA